MNLHLTKQLKPKASAPLQTLVKHLGFLRNFQDGAYLKAALEQKTPVWQVPTSYTETLLALELGPFASEQKFALTRNENSGIYFNKKFKTLEDTVFKIALVRYGYPKAETSVVVSIENPRYHSIEMSLEPILGGTSGNLFALASYFYDKPAAYQKIHAFLLEKSTLLTTQISQEYVAALLELFSLENQPVPSNTYEFSKTFSKKETCFGYLPVIKKTAIFSLAFFYQPSKKAQNALSQTLEVYATINKAGALVYDIFPVYGTEIFEPRQVLAFINKNTKFWLAELEALVAFGLSLTTLPDLKAKILISNI